MRNEDYELVVFTATSLLQRKTIVWYNFEGLLNSTILVHVFVLKMISPNLVGGCALRRLWFYEIKSELKLVVLAANVENILITLLRIGSSFSCVKVLMKAYRNSIGSNLPVVHWLLPSMSRRIWIDQRTRFWSIDFEEILIGRAIWLVGQWKSKIICRAITCIRTYANHFLCCWLEVL